MMHPDIMRLMADERLATLRHDARRPAPRPARRTPAVDLSEIDLRLCKASDDSELERLAALSEQPLPPGRLVVALVDGRIGAALPLTGGPLLADPFMRTAHLVHLLELRAAQLRRPEPRRSLVPRYVSLIRGSTQA
jgi:hypothetical protein